MRLQILRGYANAKALNLAVSAVLILSFSTFPQKSFVRGHVHYPPQRRRPALTKCGDPLGRPRSAAANTHGGDWSTRSPPQLQRGAQYLRNMCLISRHSGTLRSNSGLGCGLERVHHRYPQPENIEPHRVACRWKLDDPCRDPLFRRHTYSY